MKINIQIKPNSKKGPLVELQPDGSLIVYVREVAVDGRANINPGTVLCAAVFIEFLQSFPIPINEIHFN